MRINESHPYHVTTQETASAPDQVKKAWEQDAKESASLPKPNAGEAVLPSKAETEKYGVTIAYTKSESGAGAFDIKTSKPQDTSSYLTRRLVSASGQFEVRQIVADANKDLVQLRIIAGLSKGEDAAKARAAVKKLQKLVNRAYDKISELDREDQLKIRKFKAEKKMQLERARRIKEELRKGQIRRRARENGYLLEKLQEQILRYGGVRCKDEQYRDPAMPLDAATEAAISAQAEAIAAAEMASGDAGGAEAVAGDGPSGEGASASGGAEPAGAGVSVDLSV